MTYSIGVSEIWACLILPIEVHVYMLRTLPFSTIV